MGELWKPIKGYENYKASTFGRICSIPRGRRKNGCYLKPNVGNSGYRYVSLCKDGVPKSFTVHRLIAATFLEDDSTRGDVNHIDGDKLNNRVENLERTTRKENMIHAVANGLQRSTKGTSRFNSKLTDDDVREIRRSKGTTTELGLRFCVDSSKISRIKNFKAWKHVH